MSSRQSRTDEILFLTAFMAVLVGLALLLHTTGLAKSLSYLLPLLGVGAGGLLLFVAFLRSDKTRFLFVGLILVLAGLVVLAGLLAHWSFSQFWPLFATVVGLAWIAAGFRSYGRAKASFVAPSVVFILIGAFLSLFSFDIVRMSFGRFMRLWWPSFLILGGLALFGAWGASRRRDSRPEP